MVSFRNATNTNVTLSVTASNSCGASLAGTRQVAVILGCKNAGANAGEVVESISSLSAYPNPATNNATITFNSDRNENYLIKVADMTGRIILSERISAVEGYNEKEINLEKVSKGLYMISVRSEAGETKVLRLVVE